MTQLSGIAAYAMTSEMAPSTTTFGIVRYAMTSEMAPSTTTFAVATTAVGSSTKGPRIPAADR